MKAIERIFKYIEIKGLNKSELERNTGISNGYLAKQLSRSADIGESILINILENCPDISPEWLLTGKGDMLRGEGVNHITMIHKPTEYTEKIIESQEIPLYDINAAANLKTLFLQKNQNIIETIKLPNIPKCDGAVYVTGDSMEPIVKSGDIVLYKEIYDFNNIIYGDMYLISIEMEGDEYLALKYITRSEKGEDWICLKSHNERHSPKDFELKHVNALALIKISISIHAMR